MTLESLINFKMGTRVTRNPENHGLEIFDNNARLGTVGKIVMETISTNNGDWIRRRTGELWITWDGDSQYRVVRYEHLRIVG